MASFENHPRRRLSVFLCASVLTAIPSFAMKSARDAVRSMALEVDRKAPIHPEHPTEGIKTGLVVAYGHVIRPPYKVEIRDGGLVVNGVPITNNPVAIREEEKRKKRFKDRPQPPEEVEEDIKFGKVFTKANDFFRENKGKMPDEELHKKILDMLQGFPGHKDITWAHGDWLSYWHRFRGRYLHIIWEFSTEDPEPTEVIQARQAQNMREQVKELEVRLKLGREIIFDSTGGEGMIGDPREAVNEVMQNPKLTEQERRDLLEERVGDFGRALDILANYDPAEWRVEPETK